MATNGANGREGIETRLFINNEVRSSARLLHPPANPPYQYVKAKSGETLTVKNPVDDSIVTSDVQVAGEADVDAAVAAARAAFKTGPWKKFSGAQRAACMNKLADLIEANLEKLVTLETIAMGQPIAVGKVFTGMSPPGWRCMSSLLFLNRDD